MEGHEERAQEAEFELAEMQERSDALGDDIHDANDDWEAKKRDDSVPGAGTGEDEDEDGGAELSGGGSPEGESDEESEATGEGTPEVEDESS